MRRAVALTFLSALLPLTLAAQTPALPELQIKDGASHLLLQGKPYLVLGGEIGNSSAGTAEQADTVLPRLRAMHMNTALIPVAWEQIEPTEGKYDFNILDHWIDVARDQQQHLVLLWFGSWKNAFSNYTPTWVKADTKRFPRALSADGQQLEILSTFGKETVASDSRAFAALLAHVREKDSATQTVLMVQVENEIGYLGAGRDRSPEANALFNAAPPRSLIEKLVAQKSALAPELSAQFNPAGTTWRATFGEYANEAFMAWSYAEYVEKVAAAGKHAYALPLYTNAQLPAVTERSGEYPSGGPHPYNLDIYRAVATHIDMFSPDIYWLDFAHWVKRYQGEHNPIFIPETRFDQAPFNALYAYGEAHALGFSPFGIDDENAEKNSTSLITQINSALESITPLLEASPSRGLVLHANGLRPSQTVSLGGYLWTARLRTAWPSNALLNNDGAMLVLQSSKDDFYVLGIGLKTAITRDPDTDNRIAGIARIEVVERKNSAWHTIRQLNGDESNQGRELDMDPQQVKIYHVTMYTHEQERTGSR
jgi:hypothetical protein